ncbi:nSTAND3 domain-containing NTPase [Rhizobium ruizarguesonis]|uniref:nSTAND3 domain-containing NTPase n=1 Tax=Rhizobium ruizarguesonis TaxID=2081791 RepID=UPI001031BFDC|nr:hypothetical protein [Rhizobium ruizarguesonis]TBB60445.1 hypothetical protein ELH45_34515 [Rhizobium ruizarguesonis]
MAGFEYQLEVSVFAALRILLFTKSAGQVELEPDDEEDLGADIESSSTREVTQTADLATGQRLVIQVKLVSGDPWTLEEFDALLRHGTKRTPACERLKDPRIRYLLVTSAAVRAKLKDLEVSSFEEIPDLKQFPASLRSTLDVSPEGRVAILPSFSRRMAQLETDSLLREHLHVPQANIAKCKESLFKSARERMRGDFRGVWTQAEVLSIVQAHGGYLASAPELVSFVAPSNFDEMLAMLREKNALVIRGPSGTGKTIAALAICDRIRESGGGVQVVPIGASDDPAATRWLYETGPKLFYIEDPWGQVSLRGGSDAWTEQLPKLLATARPDHQYVITSRSDMLRQAAADRRLQHWSVELNANAYMSGELNQIYDKRMRALPPHLRPMALSFQKDALGVLTTPMEVDLFFTKLAEGPEEKEAPRAFFERLKQLAHREAVEEVVLTYLQKSDSVGISAVIWALLAAKGQFDRNQLTGLQRELRTDQSELGAGLEKLVDRLEATRHLRQPGRIVSFAHPGVGAGFKAFLLEDWYQTETALIATVSALLKVPGNLHDWATEAAARVIAVATSLAKGASLEISFDEEDRHQIDHWLEAALCDPSSDFIPLLRLAADVGSLHSNPAELARWFLNGFRRGGDWFDNDWQPPSFTVEWYARLSADPRTAVVVDRFIREQLVQDHHVSFGRDFVDRLDPLANNTAPALVEAAQRLVSSGFSSIVDTVAGGAARDLVAFAPVLTACLDEMARLESKAPEREKAWTEINDGEHDAAYDDYLTSVHEDDGYGASTLIEAYVSAVRAEGGWQSLTSHPRLPELLWYWARDLWKAGAAAGSDEVLSLLDHSIGTSSETDAWFAARSHWFAELDARLVKRFEEAQADDVVREGLIGCLIDVSSSSLPACLSVARRSPSDLIRFLIALRNAGCHGAIVSELGQRARGALDIVEKEIFDALREADQPAEPVGQAALSLLERAAPGLASTALDHVVPIIHLSGGDVASAMKRWLWETEDHKVAERAASFIARQGDRDTLWDCLDHRRADARKVALDYFLSDLPDPLPAQVLKMAIDPGHRVRRSLLQALASRLHTDHLPVLVRMTGDTWSDATPHFDEPESFPIARKAVSTTALYPDLAAPLADHFLTLARTTKDRALSRLCLTVAAAKFSFDVQSEIWKLVDDQSLGIIRVDAVDALASAPSVKPEILQGLTGDEIAQTHVAFAPSLARLAARQLPLAEVVEVLDFFARTPSCRSLGVVGAVALLSRDRQAAEDALSFLPSGHPARRILDLSDKEKLPASVLDDLGDVHLRQWIVFALEDQIKRD